MVDKDDFSGFAPLQPQVRHHRWTVSLAKVQEDVGVGVIPQHAKGSGLQWGANSSIATMNFLLLMWAGGGHCPHVSAALSIIGDQSPNPPTFVVEANPVP